MMQALCQAHRAAGLDVLGFAILPLRSSHLPVLGPDPSFERCKILGMCSMHNINNTVNEAMPER